MHQTTVFITPIISTSKMNKLKQETPHVTIKQKQKEWSFENTKLDPC